MANSLVFVVGGQPLGRTSAYISGFQVNKATLEFEHHSWLHELIGNAYNRWSHRGAKNTDYFVVWLLGTASRTGRFKDNVDLSRQRAASVHEFLRLNCAAKRTLPYSIIPTGLGETPAFLKGKRDNLEDPFERSVLLVAEWHSVPTPRAPEFKRPVPTKFTKDFIIHPLRTTVEPGLVFTSVEMDLLIIDVARREAATYKFTGEGIPLELDIEKSKINKSFKKEVFSASRTSGFETWFLRRADSFAGRACLDLRASQGASIKNPGRADKLRSDQFKFDPLGSAPKGVSPKFAQEIEGFDAGVNSDGPLASHLTVHGEMKLVTGIRPHRRD